MKLSLAVTAFVLCLVRAIPPGIEKRANPQGFDVSNFQPTVDWATAKANGATFVIIKVFTLSPPCHPQNMKLQC